MHDPDHEEAVEAIMRALDAADLSLVAFAWSDPVILDEDAARELLHGALREEKVDA